MLGFERFSWKRLIRAFFRNRLTLIFYNFIHNTRDLKCENENGTRMICIGLHIHTLETFLNIFQAIAENLSIILKHQSTNSAIENDLELDSLAI